MCGINGKLSFRPDIDPVVSENILHVRDTMVRRGPDAEGYWMAPDRRVAFGHRRLAIIDLSEGGLQPMHSPDGQFTIVFNGEIYNYLELKKELSAKGYTFRTTSDTEVILTMFREYGEAMLGKLRGMFSIALWDSATKQLLLARDPLGIKPLYYWLTKNSITFASQVKALLAGGADTTPSPEGHVGFMLWGHLPDPYTLYRDIRALPAGSYLIADEDGPKPIQKYFRLNEVFENPNPGVDLHAALEDTAEHHLISDVPVSLFLSAGRDSATLLALATENPTNSIGAVTLSFQEYLGTENDETILAKELSAQYGVSHLVQLVSGDNFRSCLPDLLASMDQPSIDGANTYFVCKAAAELNVKVALSGLGGDELFGGYPSFHQVPRLVRSMGHAARIPGLRPLIGLAVGAFGGGSVSPKYGGLMEHGDTVEGAFLLRRCLFLPNEIPSILDPDFAAEGLAGLQTFERLREATAGLSTMHAQVAALELQWYMMNRLLKDSDWASMAHSLELRVPFVDVDLLRILGPAIASASPPTKAQMAASPKHALPASILDRPKTGFSIPVREWLLGVEPDGGAQTSYRRWARFVYKEMAGDQYLQPTAAP